MRRFSDINLVRQELKSHMSLDQFISLADKRYTTETGKKCDPLEYVNDHLYKKRCDLDEHPIDADGTKDSTPSLRCVRPRNYGIVLVVVSLVIDLNISHVSSM